MASSSTSSLRYALYSDQEQEGVEPANHWNGSSQPTENTD
jgi:hypothetical protein